MTRTRFTNKLIALSLLFLLSTNLYVSAAEKCTPWVAKAISVQGNVEKRSIANKSSPQWLPIKRDDELCAGEIIRVKQNSRAALILKNDTILRLNQNTTITLSGFNEDQSHWLNLNEGMAHFIARIKQSFKVITPFVNAAVEGTEFVISVTDSLSEVTVFEGVVKITNKLGEVKLTKGQTAVATENTSPNVIIKINSRDTVQWSLYYPAVINYENLLLDNKSNIKVIEQSIAAAYAGKINNAIYLIETIPSISDSIELQVYKATLYLSVGRINKAHLILQHQTTNHQGLALQSIIATVNNDKVKALKLAKQATSIAPDAYETALALSYVHQSMFKIGAALSVIQASNKKNKDNALLWSRLSELYLMTGELDKALNSAKEAIKLNPNISRTHTTLGFAFLTQIKITEAQEAFTDAIKIDDTDPLSHLGLGLAIIRQGDLAKGRQLIEFATTLDPNNALIRSYLGKAYFEEKRDNLATVQFEMAKQLDPKDPTASYYSAIQKQSLNQPVNALNELQKSINLNNNRAVYRSSLLLDQDEAARSASLARIYDDLGYGLLALREGTSSINNDPFNSSAHRFLSDSYSTLARHQIARVSELLRSQLLQPLNLNSLQPQLATSNLGILDGTGPSKNTFSEYNPMFTRNNIDLQFNVIQANNNTHGNDLVISGLHNNITSSLGQFHYKTNGFRKNNDLKHDIYNAFIQSKVTKNLNLQIELRDRKTESGDLRLKYDPNIFEENQRQKIKSNTSRFGLKYQLVPNQFILGSILTNNYTGITSNSSIAQGPPFPVETQITTTIKSKALLNELQYNYSSSNFKQIFGITNIDLNQNDLNINTKTALPPGPSSSTTTSTSIELNTDHTTIYYYSNLKYSKNIIYFLGLAYDDYKIQNFNKNKINPKLGLQYDINSNTVFRTAAFSIIKRPIVTNQTIEPTNIAGFNQFYDDNRGAEINQFGISLEHSFSKKIKTGIESNLRTIKVPIVINNNAKIDKYDEQSLRSYLYFTLNNTSTITTEFHYESFDRSPLNNNNSPPLTLKTTRIPLGFNYSSASRYSFRILSSFIDQSYTDNNSILLRNNFWITHFSISYKFKQRMGKVTFGIKNIFNKKFNFYDLEFSGEPRLPLFIPEQTIFAKFNYFYN